MSYLTKIINEIRKDFEKKHYNNKKSLSRRIKLKNGIQIFISLNNYDDTRCIGIMLEENYDKNIIKKLPKWKGIEHKIVNLLEDNQNEEFLIFEQLSDYEAYIYEIILNDILINLSELANKAGALNKLYFILNKWKIFFEAEFEIRMSDIRQQGLYSELYFLDNLINLRGVNSILCWTGGNSEIHDFYVESNAIEIKSTSKKAPYVITISSEHQLDTRSIRGMLCLYFLSVRKSREDGESLKEIVNRIINKIQGNQNVLMEFKDKLFNYGYLIDYPELNELLFSVREEEYYLVNNNFPRLTTDNIQTGIGDVTYKVALDSCENCKITIDEVIKYLGGERV